MRILTLYYAVIKWSKYVDGAGFFGVDDMDLACRQERNGI